MKKTNIEFILPQNLTYESLLEVFQKGIKNSKLDDGQGNIFELEMAQVIDSSKSLLIVAKKVCTTKDSCDKMDLPLTNGESNGKETETSNTISC